MTAEDINRVYGSIRKIVPENIDLKDGIDYHVVIELDNIAIYERPRHTMIYLCRFKMPEIENK